MLRTLSGGAFLSLLCGASHAVGDVPALRSITLVGFELTDDHPDPQRDADHRRRLDALDRQLREGLTQLGLYRVVDAARAQPVIGKLASEHAFLYRCEGCAQAIGQAANSELVLVGWVQRVSELILNINVEVREVATDRIVLSKSVDLRGNNDESWTRALRFMLRDWAEKRARNPRYGQ